MSLTKHRSFGGARRAARVEEHGDVVRVLAPLCWRGTRAVGSFKEGRNRHDVNPIESLEPVLGAGVGDHQARRLSSNDCPKTFVCEAIVDWDEGDSSPC